MSNDISYLKIGLLAGGVFAGMLGALRVQDHQAAQWNATQAPSPVVAPQPLVGADMAHQSDRPVAVTPQPVRAPMPEAVEPVDPSPREARVAAREQYQEDEAQSSRGHGFVYYSRCDEARAAGVAPLYRGDPGYREGLDRDNDGIACEPYRGRRR